MAIHGWVRVFIGVCTLFAFVVKVEQTIILVFLTAVNLFATVATDKYHPISDSCQFL